jgi:hypothetical protein
MFVFACAIRIVCYSYQTDDAYGACEDKHPGDQCTYGYGNKNGVCKVQSIFRPELAYGSLLEEDAEDRAKEDDDEDDEDDDSDEEDIEEDEEEHDEDESEDADGGVEVFLQEDDEISGSPPIPPKPIIDGMLKCVTTSYSSIMRVKET